MTVRFVRPVSGAATAARSLGLGALMLLAIALLAHRFGPLVTPHFIALVLLSGLIALAAVPLALRGLQQLWRHGARGGIASVKALAYAALPLALLAFGLFRFEAYPRLFDVTTDLADPPAWATQPNAKQFWLPRPGFVAPADREVQMEAYPGLTGRRYEGAPDRIYEAVMKVAAANRMTLQRQDRLGLGIAEPAPVELQPRRAPSPPATRSSPPVPDVVPVPLPRPTLAQDRAASLSALQQASGEILLQGSSRTLILGLPFDIALRLREEAETTFVDMRVAIRYGPHDLGFGADMAETFLRALDAELLGLAAE
ncbi:DUF1499 domain-containing protein [Rhizobium sp. FY34]|uniref:DUF1499 domain-containing protein n=1 Tax=Rhizobium sp. FY34 TaxID=2562309 RepID=UPI0010C0EE96|nr:DUF1499 domain-containing protein [Rhizobium sp. FY34]